MYMKMKFYALLTTLFLLCASALWAQERTISGTVRDGADRAPVIGANVLIKGTKVGTITDVNGNFKLRIPSDNAVLKVSFIGYQSTETTVGNRSQVEVVLQADAEQLEEVVVTAFGIQQEKKALNYALQEVKAAELTDTRQTNVVNALQGKIAGVTITSSGGAPGANAQIMIRGANSLDGNNQPLFVVDGIPIDNSTSQGGQNRAADINPNDIESLTVLKGPAAAALYGIEGANGAIIIKTKSGKSGQTTVKYNVAYSVDEVGRLAPQQRLFGRGNSGLVNLESFSSWGPMLRPDQQIYENNAYDFFRTGTSINNDISVSGGNENTTFYLSASSVLQQGIVPGTDLDKTSVLLKGNNQVSKTLSVGGSVNYIRTINGRGLSDTYSGGWMGTVMRWPVDHDMSRFEDERGNKLWLFPTLVNEDARTANQSDNPYWTSKYNPVKDITDRFLLNGNINWKPIKGMSVTYRVGRDQGRTRHSKQVSYNSASDGGIPNILRSMDGAIYQEERLSSITTSTLTATYDHTFAEAFRLTALAGHNLDMRHTDILRNYGGPFLNPDLVSINNVARENTTAEQGTARRRVVSAFGDVKLDYKGIAYVGLTARNDWSSTLPVANRSFFYPGVTTGLVFSELLPAETRNVLSFGKLRAAYTQVGKDAPAHRLFPYLTAYQGPGGGFVNYHTAGNPNLKPERTYSKEIGLEMKFFNGRLGFDATYYDQLTVDQIISARITPTTGYIIQTFNGGDISNKGFEIMLTGEPIKTKDFLWDVTFNFSQSKSTLEELPGFVSEYPVAQSQVMGTAAMGSSLRGESLFGVMGYAYERTPEGKLLIGADGYPVRSANKSYLGNRQADFIGGITNTFKYKGLMLSFLVDGSFGGDIMNATRYGMISSGTHRSLEEYRDKAYVFDGVVKQSDGTYVQNTQEVRLDQKFFQTNYVTVGENFIEDVNWVRLRYVSLTYDLPKNLVKRIGMKGLSVNVTGRNLLVATNYSGGDPEVNSTGSNTPGVGTMGIDYYPVPLTKGVTLGLSATF